MSAYQWLISQQDNYGGKFNLVNEFLTDLYLNFDTSKFCYIIHDKESDLHVHCILVLNVALRKKQLLEIFPNADIRLQKASNRLAWEYLTHSTEKCIKQGKIRYNEKDIKYNNFIDLNEWLEVEKIDKKSTKDIVLLDMIVDDILCGELTCYREVLLKYKGVALKYSKSIQELFENFRI